METNRDFILRQLNSGRSIWRLTDTYLISYTKTPYGVYVEALNDNNHTSRFIRVEQAVEQLVRNFNQIIKVGKGG